LFIYPDYKEIIDEIRPDYVELRSLLDSNLKYLFEDLFPLPKILKFFLTINLNKKELQDEN